MNLSHLKNCTDCKHCVYDEEINGYVCQSTYCNKEVEEENKNE